jgi:hypothetical protein
MVLSRAQATEALAHVLGNVMGLQDISHIHQALDRDGYNNIFDFMSLNRLTIDDLRYQVDGDERNLLRAERGLLATFIDYVGYRQQESDPIGDNWTQITREQFDEFRVMPRQGPSGPGIPTAPIARVGPPNSSRPTTHSYTPADLFRKGIKRDPTLFPKLKDEKHNDTWHRALLTQARAQDVDQVLDPAYSPSTQEDIDLFEWKKKYMYAVFENNVLTDRGKAIVREHEHD